MSLSKSTVDQITAERILREAIEIAQEDSRQIPISVWDNDIKTIIQGNHLTFRYILVTALLGKATNPSINALALQAGADIEGAYDARSVCHGVVVPLERQLLNRALGGSNEPFLNKPARFPIISPSNAVRAGKDKVLLLILHKVLSEMETSEQAFNTLCTAVRYALKQQIARSTLISQPSESTDSHLKIIEFVDILATNSIEGQVAALLVGTALSTYFDQFEGFEVVVHPINQSGASSNEVADIDIKKNGKIFVAIEVKDKKFSQQDVDHAAYKVSQYGLNSITFILGINGACVGLTRDQVAKNVLQARNINVIFVDLGSFVKSVIALCPDITFTIFLAKLQNYAISARVRNEVFEHIERTFQSIQISVEPTM